jgi:hypothetical protein
MATAVGADINRMTINVIQKMIVTKEARHLFCSPYRKHLRTASENFLYAIPVDRVKCARRENIFGIVVFAPYLITPVPSYCTLI